MFPRRCWFVSIYCAGISSPATATGRRSAISVSAVSPLGLPQPGSNFLGSKNSGSMGPGHHRARAHTRGRVLGFLCIILLCYVERPERGEPRPCHVIQMCREKIYLAPRVMLRIARLRALLSPDIHVKYSSPPFMP